MATPANGTVTTESIVGVYQEVCKSYHAVDDFRMKLLGLLPLASLVGLFGLSQDDILVADPKLGARIVTFVATFAALFTIALLIYEIRGILRCSDLIKRGRELEDALNVRGQFHVCVDAHECKQSKKWIDRTSSFFDAKLAACVIYASVVSAWVFTALHFGLGLELRGCTLYAAGCGVIMGVGTFLLVRRLVAA